MKNRVVTVGSTVMLGVFLMASDSPSGLASRAHGASSAGQPSCEFSVSPTRINVEAAGQTGVIRVDTQPGCAWTASLPQFIDWIQLTGPAGGTGSGTLQYVVSPISAFARQRQVAIFVRWNTPTAGQNVIVTQTNGPCAPLSNRGPFPAPTSADTFGGVAGASFFDIFTRDGFDVWYITSAPDWIVPTAPPLGIFASGDRPAFFSILANPGTAPRDGTVVFCDGSSRNVHQAGRSLMGSPFLQTDFDGDGKADLAVYRAPSGQSANGEWFVLQSHSAYSYADALHFAWGDQASDVPVPADYDGDGKPELAVFSAVGSVPSNASTGAWKLEYSSNEYNAATATSYRFGNADALPLFPDFNGDRKGDFVAYDRPTGTWQVGYTNATLEQRLFEPDGGAQWGLSGDVPVPADFDGDGKAELAVWRPSNGTWYIRYSSDNYRVATAAAYQWGLPNDVPVIADLDGDRRADLTVWRPSNGTWYVRFSSNGYSAATAAAYQWGFPGDVPIANDFDGDGRTDFAVWRPSNGTWYLLLSSSNYSYAAARAYQWGLPGDMPLGKR